MSEKTDDSGWRNPSEEDKRQAKENFKGFLVIVAVLLVVIAGLAWLGGSGGETVVDRENPQRITESFAAEQGDQIRVNIANTAMGYRTHVAIESPSGETVLSEGVQDKGSFEVSLEETGEYTVRMDPPDSSSTTAGSVEVIILE
jgi:hypothetical protein